MDDGANVVSRDVTGNVEGLLVLAELVEDIKWQSRGWEFVVNELDEPCVWELDKCTEGVDREAVWIKLGVLDEVKESPEELLTELDKLDGRYCDPLDKTVDIWQANGRVLDNKDEETVERLDREVCKLEDGAAELCWDIE